MTVALFPTLVVADEPINLAALLTQRHPLRATTQYLASALLFTNTHTSGFDSLTFVSADQRLCEASSPKAYHRKS